MTAEPVQTGLPTVAQLKDDIDSGRTGDKVANFDPGLSPLGTDDEAGGNAMRPEQIALARETEAKPFAPATDTGSASWAGWLIPILIVLMAAMAVLFYISRR